MLKRIRSFLIILLCLSGINSVFAEAVEYDTTGDYVVITTEELVQILTQNTNNIESRYKIGDNWRKLVEFFDETKPKIKDFGEQIIALASSGEPLFAIDVERGPDGIVISASWRSGAPQRFAGYVDEYDNLMKYVGFDLDATKFQLGNGFELRLWKGDYGRAGGGGEIGIYENQYCLTREQVEAKLGVTGTILEVKLKSSSITFTGQVENRASFWTTAFNTGVNPGKRNIYTVNNFRFKSEGHAAAFMAKMIQATPKALIYPHNRDEIIPTPRYDGSGKEVIVCWGKEDFTTSKNIDMTPINMLLLD